MVQFNLTFDLNITLEQRLGFEMAALIWSQYLTDDASVNLHIGSAASLDDSEAVGGAVPIFHEVHYGVYQEYLTLDASSDEDASVLGALQDGNTVDFWVDDELVDGNTTIMLTRAQAKALGMEEALVLEDGNTWTHDMLQNPDALDGYVVINNSYDWNYDLTREAETPAGELDFLTMALHELGHSLGFVSGLDGLIETFELHSGETRAEGFTALDLMRYSKTSITIDNPDGSVSDLSFGGAAYFSLDGGATALAEFEEGSDYQASHWQRFQNAIGIMDPTLGYQERTNISELDLQAFDVLGWDVDYAALQNGLNLDALYDDALQAISQDFGIGVAAVEGAVESGMDWYTLGHGSWWQAFKEQMIELGHGGWWQEFEADLLALGHGSWWQAFDPQMTELGFGGWWQAFEEQVLALGHGGWWQQFKAEQLARDALNLGHGNWWQQFEPKMLELGFGGWWQVFEQQMLALGHGGWWQEFEASLLDLGFGSWWQAFEADVLALGFGSWWQIFEDKAIELGHGGWWQEFETSLLELGHGSWWQAFELGHGGWWQQIERHLEEVESLEDVTTIVDDDGSEKVVSGSAEDDILAGSQSQDLIHGDAGDDLIDGQGGNDIILAGAGNDIAYGFSGEDVLFGGMGDDVLAGENGNDRVYGEAGADILSGGRGDDFLDGGAGRDDIKGDSGDDVLSGGAGDDRLLGGAGADLLIGGEGLDFVNGGGDDDILYGDDFFSSSEADAPTADSAVANMISEITPTTNLDFWLRLEVEDFRLNNYSPTQQTGVSGSVVATQGKGKAISQYRGPNGVYDLMIGYYDDAGGASDITLKIKKRGASNEEYTFQLDGDTGTGAYQISGVTLATGDLIELRGESNGADLAQLDYIDILTPGVSPTFDQNGAPANVFNFVGDRRIGTWTRLEAETMELTGGYATLAAPHASEESAIVNIASEHATATLTYTGESGIYNIFANYFDHSAGQAELNVLINGVSLDRWTLDLDDDRTHERLLDLDVVLNTGDVIQIQGMANQGDQALIDYLRLEQGVDASLLYTNESGVMRVEAESMTLRGTYSIDNNSNSSGGAHLRTHKGNNLTADTTFTGETGLYDIVIGYYDRQDGVAQYTLSREGEQIDSWLADQGSSSYLRESLATHTLPSVVLNSGDSISIHAIKDGTDNGFLDYIEFAPTVTGATALDAAPVIQLDDVAQGIQLEAEALDLSYNAKIYNTSFASGGAYVMAVTPNADDDDNDDQQGNYRATTLFEGGTGYYDIEVGYYDENDGQAELIVKVDNQEVDRWFADQDLGDNSANAATFTTRTVENVHVSSLDLIELIAVEDGGDRGNLDYIKFTQVDASPTPSSNGGGPTIRVEAEDLTLVGDYSVEARDGASGGQVIRTDSNGVATLSFSGDGGLYDVVVHYVDEWDGSSSVSLRVNGVEQENWLLDQTTGWFQNAYASHTISGVNLGPSDFIDYTFQLFGFEV